MGGKRCGGRRVRGTREDRRRFGVGAALGVVLLGLVACTPVDESPPKESSSAAPTGLFSSNAEALAVTSKAFEHIMDMSTDLDPRDAAALDDYYKYLSGDALASTKEMMAEFDEKGLRQAGKVQVSQQKILDRGPNDGRYVVRLTMCFDTAQSSVVDERGQRVDELPEQTVLPYEVEMSFGEDATKYTLEGMRIWDDEKYCM